MEEELAARGGNPLPEGLIIDVARQLCDVLAYLHNMTPPIVYRDMKPSNVMLTSKGRVVLVDFGIARLFRAARKGTMIGTLGFAPPEHPTVFGRWVASLTTEGTPAPVPANEPGLDWEGEVAAIVGRRLTDVDERTALAGVLGYAAFNDLTARTAQKLTAQWTLGKNADRSGPIGPLVTADEAGDPAAGWRVRTRVNGETVQDGNTRDMIFGVGDLLSRISRTFTLQPGDVIATGTPEGVGYVRTPPWLLHPGDVVEVEIDHLGTIRTPVVGPEERL